jgi:polygalacturonase
VIARCGLAAFVFILGPSCYAATCAPPAQPGVFVVTSCGAVGNGVTDDTAAIQAAENAAEALVGGGMVIFPPLTYNIASGPIQIRRGGIRWFGQGGISYAESSQIQGGAIVYNGATLKTPGPTIVSAVATGGLNHEGPVFDNLNFVASANQRTQTLVAIGDFNRGHISRSSFRDGGVGVEFLGMSDESDWLIDGNTIFRNNVVGVDHNVSTTGGGNNTIANNDFTLTTAGDVGVRWQSGNAQGRVIGNKFDAPGSSTIVYGVSTLAEGCLIMGNNFENYGPAAIIPTPRITQDGRATRIIGNMVEGMGLPAWQISSSLKWPVVISLNSYTWAPNTDGQ